MGIKDHNPHPTLHFMKNILENDIIRMSAKPPLSTFFSAVSWCQGTVIEVDGGSWVQTELGLHSSREICCILEWT
jgi:hypothetical protein